MGCSIEKEQRVRLLKYLLLFTNLIIIIAGFVLLGIGVWTFADVTNISVLIGSQYLAGAAYIPLIAGPFIALAGYIGCIGILRQIKHMLFIYFVMFFLLFVTVLIGGALGYILRDKVPSIEQNLQITFNLPYNDHSVTSKAWDQAQVNFECCGVTGWHDWITKDGGVPESCCREAIARKYTYKGQLEITEITKFNCTGGIENVDSETTNYKGCLDDIETLARKQGSVLGAVGITVACLLLLGMVFSYLGYKMIQEKNLILVPYNLHRNSETSPGFLYVLRIR